MSEDNCHSDDVESIFVDYADNPPGSVLKVNGKCYIKTGITGYADTFLTENPPLSAESCDDCIDNT